MTSTEARSWLDTEWDIVLSAPETDPDPEVDRVVDSEVLSVRYAVVTQTLGKIAGADRGILCVQSETGEPGAWDARSFCSAVVVPWVAENHDVLGNSSAPYVNNPLRRGVLTRGMPGTRKSDKGEWAALFDFLEPLDTAPPAAVREAFRRCLHSIARRLARQSFRYPIPKRVSMARTRKVLEAFLSEPSNGLRPMSAATALMEVVGEAFGLFLRVRSQGVTEADAATGVPGDLMCFGQDEKVVLAVEVKDRNITLADVRSAGGKAARSDQPLAALLFAAPGVQQSEKQQIEDSMERAWASGLNLYRIDILDLFASSFALLDEDWRPRFLRRVGADLDRRGAHGQRRAWHDLLSSLTAEEGA